MTYQIMKRNRIEVNTDPQSRYYNGCHFSSELVWGEWECLSSNVSEDSLERKLTFWRELNDYAVSQRGESTYAEFKAEEEL